MTDQPNTEALADVLPVPDCSCDAHYSVGQGRRCREFRERQRLRQAESLLADPNPLLAALTEAGVLSVELAPSVTGRNGRSVVVPARRRYVTEWQEVQP